MKFTAKRLLALFFLAAALLNCVPAEASSADVSAAAAAVTAPSAPGTAAKSCARAAIDYSNAKDGYVMVRFSGSLSKRIRVQVKGPGGVTYTYDLTHNDWAVYPLSDGNGSYKVTVWENVQSDKYAEVVSASFKATLSSEFAPYLRPNEYVDYTDAPNSVAKAAELAGGETDTLKKVEKIYEFVVTNFSYDRQRAASASKGQLSGYVPVLDSVLSEQRGICYDYASLVTGMLRSQGVACKLIFGHAGKTYHAWISVWTDEGWVDAIYFDGSDWHRMDPTFASSGKQSESIMKYIGDGKNYVQKYQY